MRNDFEGAASSLIEVNPYRRTSRNSTRGANVSAIDYSAGWGKTGVDLRFYPKEKFLALPQDQQDELREWITTKEGKKSKKEFFKKKDEEKGNKWKGTGQESGGN